jgi:hypothetical protein
MGHQHFAPAAPKSRYIEAPSLGIVPKKMGKLCPHFSSAAPRLRVNLVLAAPLFSFAALVFPKRLLSAAGGFC